MELCLMIEGQEGVTWPQWVALARACEQHGIPSLFRSDHYMNLDGQHPERGSLDAWGTLCGARRGDLDACGSGRWSPRPRFATRRCSPRSSRPPTTSPAGGSTSASVPAGTSASTRPTASRSRLRRSGWTCSRSSSRSCSATGRDEPFTFEGAHYTLRDLDAQPKPIQRPHPPLIIGGSGGARSAALAARFADEYNTPFATVDDVRTRRAAVLAACEQAGREPLPFSIMTGVIVGRDDAELRERVGRLAAVTGPGRRRAAVRAAAGVDHRDARRGDRAVAGAARGRGQPRDVPAAAARRPGRGRPAGRGTRPAGALSQ